MSALFRAEIASLQRLVEAAAQRRAQDEVMRQTEAQRLRNRSGHLHRITERTRAQNRATIIGWLQKQRDPASANKCAEATGIDAQTTLKHLRALADEGIAIATRTAGGQSRFTPARTA